MIPGSNDANSAYIPRVLFSMAPLLRAFCCAWTRAMLESKSPLRAVALTRLINRGHVKQSALTGLLRQTMCMSWAAPTLSCHAVAQWLVRDYYLAAENADALQQWLDSRQDKEFLGSRIIAAPPEHAQRVALLMDMVTVDGLLRYGACCRAVGKDDKLAEQALLSMREEDLRIAFAPL